MDSKVDVKFVRLVISWALPSRQQHRVTSGRIAHSPFFHTSWKTPVRQSQGKWWIPVWPQSTSNAIKSQNGQYEGYLKFYISPHWLQLTEVSQGRWGTVSANGGWVAWCGDTHGSWAVQIKTQGVSQQRTKQPLQHWIPVQRQYLELGHQKNRNSASDLISQQTCKPVWSQVLYFQGRSAILSLTCI